MHLLGAMGSLILLAGCVATGSQPQTDSRSRSVPLEDMFVAPPVGGPALLDVVERRYPNATEQRILLANRSAVAGENQMLVQFFGPVGNTGTGRSPLPNRSLHAVDLGREMREAVPGVRMMRSTLYVQNRYGPFGYAVGRAPSGDTCVYAWQRIAGVDTSTLLLRDRGAINIRFRLCDAEASEERLLFSMYGFSIRAFFSNLMWNPYGSPPPADARLGELGSPILPEGARGFQRVVEEAPPAPAAQPRRAAAPRPAPQPPAPAAAAAPPPLPAPIGPIVPPPPGAAVPAPQAVAVPASTAAANAPAVPPPPCTPGEGESGRC